MTTLFTKQEQTLSWKEISEGVKVGTIKLAVSDEIKMELKTGEPVTMQVVRISEDGKRVTLVSKDCLATEMSMNSDWTNKGGWRDSELRQRLNTEVFEQLPDDLAAVILPTIRRQYVDRKIVECEDKLWIPSEYEIHGSEVYARRVEGEEQFEAYKDRRNRMKKIGSDGEDTNWYWCSSPHALYATEFCHVYSYGDAGTVYASTALGVPVCFEI